MQGLNNIREIILELPEVTEKSSPGGAICFFIHIKKTKKTIGFYHNNIHGDGRESLWCPAYPDLKKELIRNKPQQYFQPQTSSAGHFSTWLGIYLNAANEDSIDWELASKIVEEAFRMVAPKSLISELKK